jgi:hypothetical protein
MVKTAVQDAQREGDVAAMRYLFEMIGLSPAGEAADARSEEPSLEQTLLESLGIAFPPALEREIAANGAGSEQKQSMP